MHRAGTFRLFKNQIPAQTIPLHTGSTVKGGQNLKNKKNTDIIYVLRTLCIPNILPILFKANFEKMISYFISVFTGNKERKLYRYSALTPGVLII